MQKFIENFILGDGINGRGRFVCNQKSRFHGGCNADHDALEHTAGKLMRIFFQHFLRDSDAHFFQQFQYEILNELLHIKENHNTAMIFISHDLNAISRVADRIVVLNHGAVVDRGDFRHILHHAQDPYTKLLVEKRADVMRRYTAVLNGKKETAHA